MLGERWLLHASEAGATLHPLDRSLLLLRLAELDGGERGEAADWPLPRRDHALLALGERLFGDALPCIAECPACGNANEFVLSARCLRDGTEAMEEEAFEEAGVAARLRPLTTRDLALVGGEGGPAGVLLRQAVVDLRERGETRDFAQLPEPARRALAERVEAREGAGEMLLAVTCHACAHGWSEPFDAGGYVWQCIAHAARRIVAEVAALARAFGWREEDTLAVPPSRRRLYLEAAA